MAENKIFIPTFIANADYEPARVQPRVFYFNGVLDAPDYKVDAWVIPSGFSRNVFTETRIPYFDHYNTGSSADGLPAADSDSLLFQNEAPAYGSTPTNTLFSEYWSKYIGLLYNPTTRLIEAQAVIPLADYFELELNDIIEWRGNYYHLRAINDYSFTTNQCNIQLLGPIIADALDTAVPQGAPTTTTTTTSTTTTTTTTTTTADPYTYYEADRYACEAPSDTCSQLATTVTVKSTTALSVGRFYSIADGYVYTILGPDTGPSSIDLSFAPFDFDCDMACVI